MVANVLTINSLRLASELQEMGLALAAQLEVGVQVIVRRLNRGDVRAYGIDGRPERAGESAVLSGLHPLTRKRGGSDDNRHGCEGCDLALRGHDHFFPFLRRREIARPVHLGVISNARGR
jgi:hypothetical protein